MKTSLVLSSLLSLAFVGAASAATVSSAHPEAPAGTQIQTQKAHVAHKMHSQKTASKSAHVKHKKMVAHKATPKKVVKKTI